MALRSVGDASSSYSQNGIYELKGDVLRVHLGADRAKRPSDWEIPTASGAVIFTFRRDPGFAAPLDRNDIEPDPRDWRQPLQNVRFHYRRDAFGRIAAIRFKQKVNDEHLAALKRLKVLEELSVASSLSEKKDRAP